MSNLRRYLPVLVALAAFAHDSAFAQGSAGPPPDSVAAEFQAAIGAKAWRTVALLAHNDALDRIKRRIDMLVELDESDRTFASIFGDLSRSEYSALSSGDAFVSVMAAIDAEMPGLIFFMIVRDIEVLGAVAEPTELAHVVYRSSASVDGATPEIRVMTLKSSEDGWRVLASQELDVIWEAVRGFFLREVPP